MVTSWLYTRSELNKSATSRRENRTVFYSTVIYAMTKKIQKIIFTEELWGQLDQNCVTRIDLTFFHLYGVNYTAFL